MWRLKRVGHGQAVLPVVLRASLAVWALGAARVRAELSNGIPRPDHVVIVVDENRAYLNTIGSAAAPYINSLAERGASFTEFYAIGHPSQPNYLALFSGSTQGVGDDSCPHSFNAPNLGTELLDAGFTFAAYSEGLPGPGSSTCDAGVYARKHAPWSNFVNLPARTHLPFSQFPSDFSQLPTLSFVIPGLNNDMHSGSTQQGDAWLRNHLDAYVQWAQTHNSLFILIWDEGGDRNQIPAIFVGPMVQPGMYCGRVNHYHLLRTLEDMFGLTYAGSSRNVPPIANVWIAGNPAPEIALTSPPAGAQFVAPTNITLAAEATSTAGAIAKVEFFYGDRKLGEAVAIPYAFTWTNAPAGNWCLSAKATDVQGGLKGSIPVAIQVTGSALNPFAAAKGFYFGLFMGSNPPAFTNSGYLTLHTTSQGTFGGWLFSGGQKYQLKGRFDSSGSARLVIARSGLTPLSVELNLNLFGPSEQMHGTVSDGSWQAAVECDRAVNTLAAGLPQPGRYLWLVPGSEDASMLPGGIGFGNLNLSSHGRIQWTAMLGDGSRFSQAATLSQNGRTALYASLYGGGGTIMGWLKFPAAPTNALEGELHWFKPAAAADHFYPDGFSIRATISGALYRAPAAGERLFPWTNGMAVLSGGNLNSAVTNLVTAEANQQLTVASNDLQLKITIVLPTGAVSGSFVHPVTHQRTKLRGTVQSGLGLIGGQFQGSSQTGSFLVIPTIGP